MDVVKKSKVEVRDETLWAIKEALDNSEGFVIHISWIDSEGVIKHYNSQRDFLIEDLEGVRSNVSTFIDSNFKADAQAQADGKRRGG